jgi:hypothetical protein
MSKTTEKAPVRIPEEDQGAINPLAGVFEVSKKKEIKFREGKIAYSALVSAEEDGTYAGWEVWTNKTDHHGGHFAGILYFDPGTRKFFHYGFRQTNLNGKDSADKVGATSGFDQAVKNLLKSRYPEEFKTAVAF